MGGVACTTGHALQGSVGGGTWPQAHRQQSSQKGVGKGSGKRKQEGRANSGEKGGGKSKHRKTHEGVRLRSLGGDPCIVTSVRALADSVLHMPGLWPPW